SIDSYEASRVRVEQHRLAKYRLDVVDLPHIPRVPDPTGTQEEASAGADLQARMVHFQRLSVSRSQSISRLDILHLQLIRLTGAVNDHIAAVGQREEGNWILKSFSIVEISVNLPDDALPFENNPLGPQLLVNHRVPAIRKRNGPIKAVTRATVRILDGAIERI